MDKRGSFIIFDGIDGSGKTTAVRSFANALLGPDQKLIDLIEWCKNNHRLPLAEEFQTADVVISGEPTHAWVGAAIRNELIRNGTSYHPRLIAEAFALDRMMLYQRLIIPLRQAGVTIVQDRSVSTSIVYQAGEHTGVSLDSILELSGNKLALEHAPDLLVITDCHPEIALSRIEGRTDKRDDSHFEHLEILQTHAARFRAPWFKELWESHGTRVVYLEADQPLAEVQAACKNLARSITCAAPVV